MQNWRPPVRDLTGGAGVCNAARASGSAQFKPALEKGVDLIAADQQARKHVLARRLVWLMLSAR